MATIFVNRNANGDNNGTSWDNAYTDLQSALEVATSEDQIWIAEGTYRPTTTLNRNISFVIPSGVEIYGGFAGEETILEQRDYLANETILDGNIGDEDTSSDNSFHVVNISSTSADTIIDGLTVAGGRAEFNTSNEKGGGIYGQDNSNATLRNLTIASNYAYDRGGGMYIGRNSNVTIDSVIFRNNFADRGRTVNNRNIAGGGAIYFFNSRNPIITNSLFYDNNAERNGGAIYNSASEDLVTELTIKNSTFVNNSSYDDPYGFRSSSDSIYVSDGGVEDVETIENSIFWDTEGGDNLEIDRGSDSSTPIINNSIVLGGYFVEGESETNISDVPVFVNPGEGDYRLQPNSPGINGGNNEAVGSNVDLAGNPRLFDSTLDLGAYEYGFFISVEDVVVEEGREEDVNAEFNVTLLDSIGNPTNQAITVNYATVDGTAIAGEDFTPTSGTLSLSSEETTQTIVVPVVSDSTSEDAETFFVELSDLSGNAAISGGRAVGTISDNQTDEEISEVSISIISTLEGKIGTLDSSGEFSLITEGEAFYDIAASQNNKLYGVSTNNQLYEVDLNSETFSLVGSLTSSVTLNALAFDNNNVLYGSESSNLYTIDVDTGAATLFADMGLNFDSSGDLIFDSDSDLFFATSRGESSDVLYSVSSSGEVREIGNIGFDEVWGLSIESDSLIGFTSNRQRISINKETGAGTLETSITTISDQISGATIFENINSNGSISITIDDVAVEEGKEGETTIDFTVSLDEAATETITVNYATVADTATADEDFIATEGILTFAPEEREKTISVLVNGDTNMEEDETFFFELSNPTGNATLENETAVATIQDDDRDDDRVAPLNTTINRFRNKDVPGTYLFAGETESENIRENFANFEDEGVAFQVAAESGDDLIPLYRFQSTRTPGTYLFAGEAEREDINENFSDDFNEEGLAFYVYGVGAGEATEFVRFQNSDRPGTYLFAGPEEAEGIRDNFPSFEEEGVAFEVVI